VSTQTTRHHIVETFLSQLRYTLLTLSTHQLGLYYKRSKYTDKKTDRQRNAMPARTMKQNPHTTLKLHLMQEVQNSGNSRFVISVLLQMSV
jgi:hypothetical protein